MVEQFIEFTNCEDSVAKGVLKKFKWSLDQAMENYWNDPEKYNKEFRDPKKPHDKPGDYEAFFREYAEFIAGMSKIRAKTLSQLKEKLPNIRAEIGTLGGLKPLYTYAFELCRDKATSHHLMKYELAEILWGQLILPSVYPHIKEWLAFLKEYHKEMPVKKAITKDVWNMFYEFIALTVKDKGGLDRVIEEGVWPTIIEDYAKYLKAKLNA